MEHPEATPEPPPAEPAMRGPAPGFVPGPIGGVGDGPLLQFYNAA